MKGVFYISLVLALSFTVSCTKKPAQVATTVAESMLDGKGEKVYQSLSLELKSQVPKEKVVAGIQDQFNRNKKNGLRYKDLKVAKEEVKDDSATVTVEYLEYSDKEPKNEERRTKTLRLVKEGKNWAVQNL